MGGIWIDLDNSPHVPLFAPVIEHYRSTGVDVILTARDHAQTIELLDAAGFAGSYTVIGRHYGKGKVSKIRGLIVRTLQLAKFIRKRNKPRVAVSHGSRSMVLAARLLRIPVITMYDYEFTETRIFNSLSDKVLVPDAIPDGVLDGINLGAQKREKYPGIKEELYTRRFIPDPVFWPRFVTEHEIIIDENTVIVVLRPPATTANYHNAQSNEIFRAVLENLLRRENVFTVITPRTATQSVEIRAAIDSAGSNHLILETAVDGMNLIWNADVLISGGGTMNREAVLLGTPVYSIFQGEQGSLDREMEREGQITFLRSPRDVENIRIERKERTVEMNPLDDRVELFVGKHIDFFLNVP